MASNIPSIPGYYRDFEDDLWRLEENGSWTLRPGTALEKREAGDFWRYQPMRPVPVTEQPPAARIEAAVRWLERKRDRATPGPWVIDSGIPDVIESGKGYVVADCMEPADASLIAVVRRSIDGQLAVLRLALEYGELKQGQGSRFIAAATELADAILGGE